MSDYSAFVGLDVHKDTIAVAVADAGRTGEVRFWGEIANTPDAVAGMLRKLGGRHPLMHFVYEAGPCGYGLHRQITATQHHCEVVSHPDAAQAGGAHSDASGQLFRQHPVSHFGVSGHLRIVAA